MTPIYSNYCRKHLSAVSFQVLDMSDAQYKWVYQHMGHTENVHNLHYRSRSDIIEHVEMAKLRLIQDNNLVHKFVGKSLQDIQMSGTITVTKTFLPELMPLEIKFDVPLSLLDPLLNSFAPAAVMSFNYLSLSHAHSHSLALPEQRTCVCVCVLGRRSRRCKAACPG